MRLRSVVAVLSTVAHASLVQAGFPDPLDTPAVSAPGAQFGRLTAVANAGRRLVAVGPDGQILISEDSGKKWQQVAVPLSSDLVSVKFVTPEKGWAVGHDGVILHTGDGGRSWTKQLDGRRAVQIMQDYYGKRAAANDPAAIKLTEDIKRFVAEGPDKPFLDVQFVDELRGFAVGAFNLAFRTKDGGRNWEPMIDRTDNPKALHLYALAASGDAIYMAGEQGLLRRWNEEQDRFESIESPYRGSYFGVIARGSMVIVFGMRGNAYRSGDKGQSWHRISTGVSGGITSGGFLPDGRIVLVSQVGLVMVSKDGGNTFEDLRVESPMPYFSVVASAGSNALVLVGTKGVRIESIE